MSNADSEFGCAHTCLHRSALHLLPSSEQMTTNIGTPVYAAPELHSDERTGQYSTKVDVYSFGIIIWSLLTRQRPYSDQKSMSTFSLVAKIVAGLRPTLSEDFPPMLSKLMVRCWASDPEDRPMFSEILIVLDRTNLMALKGEEPVRSRGLSRGLSRRFSSSSSKGRTRSNSKESQDVGHSMDGGDTATQFLMGARQKARRNIERRRTLVPNRKPSVNVLLARKRSAKPTEPKPRCSSVPEVHSDDATHGLGGHRLARTRAKQQHVVELASAGTAGVDSVPAASDDDSSVAQETVVAIVASGDGACANAGALVDANADTDTAIMSDSL